LLSPFWLPPLADWLKLPAESFSLVIFNFTVTAFWMHIQFALQGAKLPRLQSILMMLERVLNFLMLLALAMSGRLSWQAAIWAYTIPPLLLTIVGLWQLKPLLSGRIVLERARLKKILKFSLPLPIYSLLGHLSFNHLDAVFILQYLSTADLGVYSVAYQINGFVTQLSALAGSLLMPLFVTFQSNNQEKQIPTSYFQNILPALVFGLGFLCVVIATIGYYLLPLIFGEKFGQIGVLLWVLIASSAVSVPVLTGFLPLSNSTSTTYIQMIAAATAATANIVCNFLLIPRFGLIGCAWATVISFAVSMLTYAALMSRKFTLPCFTTILATLPAILGAACFSWSGNVILSNLIVFCSGLVFFILNRNTLLKGYEQMRAYIGKGVTSPL
jgi:O-antigen/teichoic acid export membrane protein